MPEKTPLFETHKKLGGKVIDFAGWLLPVAYSNISEEHNTVRNACGLFDVSHMGEIRIKGKDAEKLVQKTVSRDISKQEIGQVKLTVMCNAQGGIIDDLTVYKLGEEEFYLVVNAGTTQRDFEWLKEQGQGMEIELFDESKKTAKIDVQGPQAQQVLQKLTETSLNEIKFYHFKETKVDGINCIVSRSGYTGEDGFELYFDAGKAELLWNKLLETGKEKGIKPCGLGCRDTLRLEAGFLLSGTDFDESKTPLECGYGWVVSWEKDFIGKEALLKQKKEGIAQKLVGFELLEKGIARHGCKIFCQGNEAGIITSGTFSPTLQKSIGLGYIAKEFAEIGAEIQIQIRDSLLKAKTVKLPFYKRKN